MNKVKPNGEDVIQEKPRSNRCLHVDIIKGWAMLTIIVFHCSTTCIPDTIGHLMGNPWNVPVFFIVGGFFLKEESLSNPKSFLIGKFKRLYLPATIIYGINVLLHNLFVHIGWYPLGGNHPASGLPFAFYDIKETVLNLLKVVAAGGSGELSMGAMWFLYSMLYAFVGMTIIYWLLSFLCKTKESQFKWMTVVLMALATVSCISTQKYGITLSRFSTAVTAMFLIWWGMIINKKWKWEYNQWWRFAAAIVVFIHCVMMHNGRMVLAHNRYQDLTMLLAGSSAAIYIWGFIGKKIETNVVGKFLALMGKESLFLMAFHITGFFLCNSVLANLGVIPVSQEKGLYTYIIGDSWILLFVYLIFAIATSFAILYLYRGVRLVFFTMYRFITKK